MAQTGFSPLQTYSSSTPGNTPAAGNLLNNTVGSELAINIADGKLFYKDSSNAVQVIGWKVRPATAGGTGITSFAVGDLLYADTTTTLAKLADVATGNSLISGGVSTAPSWGKIGLTTHVSGTLPVANGGTGTGTAGITAFNNITGYTASGATGTTSTNLVFSTSAVLITPKVTTTIGVGNATPAATGSGVSFPNTQSLSSDVNTLDDYEEGTYVTALTPTTSGSITLNTSYNTLSYTKVGNFVSLNGLLVISSVSSPVGAITLNLPFTINGSGTQYRTTGIFLPRNTASVNMNQFVILGIEGNASVNVFLGNSTVEQATSAQQMSAGVFVYINISFFTA